MPSHPSLIKVNGTPREQGRQYGVQAPSRIKLGIEHYTLQLERDKLSCKGRRINRARRLLSYRSIVDRKRYRQQCEESLLILALLEREGNEEALQALRSHLEQTISNLQEIRQTLEH